MIASDYRMAPWGVGQIAYRASFASLCAGGCCLPDLNQIACIDANAFMAGEFPDSAKRHTETVLAVHSNDSGCYAWDERRYVENCAHQMRRLYNFSLGLLMSGRASYAELRGKLYFVIVKDGVAADLFHEMSMRLESLVDVPWEYEPADYRDTGKKCPEEVYKLSGWICCKAYVLRPSQIGAFIAKKGWR